MAGELVTAWFLPAPVIETLWFGPDGRVETVLAQRPEAAAIPMIIGPQGKAGPVGPSPRIVHVQNSEAATWTVNHDLGFRPQVAVLSPGGVEVEAHVLHASDNQVQIHFAAPYRGSAVLS